ncbi:hypothetical protein ABZY03_07135 [Streptomyces klenkii]|uniref:hypothetical protein n=1 Tax=Streptomyces klenkii TaxID=1420899 RepID=UPI0033A479DA
MYAKFAELGSRLLGKFVPEIDAAAAELLSCGNYPACWQCNGKCGYNAPCWACCNSNGCPTIVCQC